MSHLFDVPITAVTSLTPERSVVVVRAILRSECGYAKLSPSTLTISERLTIPDGGIDAEVSVPPGKTIPSDCVFQAGLTGFQIKSGTSFKPWTRGYLCSELVGVDGKLHSEVERLIRRGGCYTLLCTGHDLTPKQRNDSRQLIAVMLAEAGFQGGEERVEVLGASQIAEFAQRYPGTASLLADDTIQEAWGLEEWQRDAHMANAFETSPEQDQMIAQVQAGIQGETKHIRVLGEPGLGKTRVVLEAVKNENIAPYVLYMQHGSQFGRTRLFRKLLKSDYNKPFVLVLDELSESEMSDIWRHLKPRCGNLKIVSMDHGDDETHDEEIDRLIAPRLSDETIMTILASRVGKSHELDRWVAICEGSPRVAQAVADNLHSNPDDILKPPSTVPIWKRFLHSYQRQDEGFARQIDCVTQHLALFSRFGYEAPVSDEAVYIGELVRKADPTIGRARFQEIVQSLRSRRVLQGSKTLFFVPKALHIYLWKQFWSNYGHGFDFTKTFNDMPKSLHIWFMKMFKFSGEAATKRVVDDILRLDGYFSDTAVLTSEKGSRFLSVLAEANSAAVLKLLEFTLGRWTNEELLGFKENRQNLVWALGKVAVWPTLTVRAIHLLGRFSVNENANYNNNATGTLVELFRIDPEAAATESSPEARLPAMQKLLRSTRDEERRLGLNAMGVALDMHGMSYRQVGPEYQGLKPRAKLWVPATHGELWQAKLMYFQALIHETKNWPPVLRSEVCDTLLGAVAQQIRTPPCTELAFQTLSALVSDSAMKPEKLNEFFWQSKMYADDGRYSEIVKRIKIIERRYTRRNLASRFRRYVLDLDWMEWDEDYGERHSKPNTRAKFLVNALARRIAKHPETLSEIRLLLSPAKNGPALWHFGHQLGLNDPTRAFLRPLSQLTLETKHAECLVGYLLAVRSGDPELYFSTVTDFLGMETTAWLGANITLHADYDDRLFAQCLELLKKKWIVPKVFSALHIGRAIESVPPASQRNLFSQLKEDDTQDSRTLLMGLLDAVPFNEHSQFDSAFVFSVVSQSVPGEDKPRVMRGYHWKKVCVKLIKWEADLACPMLDALLIQMRKSYRSSFDSNVASMANELVQGSPIEAWNIIRIHLEETHPHWNSGVFQWLAGGLSRSDESASNRAIDILPLADILEWIEQDPEPRSALIAQATPATLDDKDGGRLTQELLRRHGQFDGVRSGVSATFRSGEWEGPTSSYLRRKREKCRRWLAAGFDIGIVQWVEAEIEYLDRQIEREDIDEERSGLH